MIDHSLQLQGPATGDASGSVAAPVGTDVMNIASVCSLFPSLAHPEHGVFVARRLAAVSRLANVRVLHAIPWFPFVRPYSLDRQSDPAFRSEMRVTDQRLFYLPKVFKSWDGAWLKRSVLPTLRRWKSEFGIQCIDAHFGFPEGYGCVEAGKELGLPVFVTLRGVEQELVEDRSIRPKMIAALKSAAGCIAVSENLRECVVSCGVPAERVRVIPNAVDPEMFRPGDRASARAALNVPSGTPLIVSVGNLKPVKQQHLLVEAFAHIKRQFQDARLVLIGGTELDPAFTARVRDRISQLQVDDCVDFAGEKRPAEVAQWLQAADVFAMASRREGCCNAVLEALACRVPVVATDVGDNARFIKSSCGCVVPPGDSAALAEGLATVLSDRREVDWTVRGMSRTWDDVAQESIDYFTECLTARARRS